MAKALVGLKVLIVEDDYLIASVIEQLLTAAGCIVSEPIPRLLAALQAAKRGNYDAAVLDINLNGEGLIQSATPCPTEISPISF